jgi:hypothetical protein
VSFSWVDARLVTLHEGQQEQRFTARLLPDERLGEDRLRERRDEAWRRSGWVETALYGSRTLRLT